MGNSSVITSRDAICVISMRFACHTAACGVELGMKAQVFFLFALFSSIS
jgi:hypothetical protein